MEIEKISFCEEEVLKKVRERFLNVEDVNFIMSIYENICLKLKSNLELDSPKCKIKLISPSNHTENFEKGELALASFFDCQIEGLDSIMIRSVEIPKLDYSSDNFFELKLEINPFFLELKDFLKNLKNKEF